MPCFAHYLSAVWPDTPEALMGVETRRKIDAAAEVLPGGLANYLLGFECPLGDPEPLADLQVSIGPGQGGRGLLGHDSLAEHLPDGLLQSFPWQKASELATRWADPAGQEHQGLECLWLEFDMESQPMGRPLPSVFFGPKTGPQGSGPAEYQLTLRLLDLLHEPPLSVGAVQSLQRCWEHLPDKAVIFQVGLMLPRLTGQVRVCIRKMAPDNFGTYLKAVGWPGPPEELASTIKRHCALFDNISLTFDVGEQIGERVGLECYFTKKAQPAKEPRWQRVMEELTESGLCLPSKAQAFLAYPRAVDLFPTLTESSDRGVLDRFPIAIMRGLHHLKIVYNPGGRPQAKGYTWGGFVWRDLATPAA